MLNKKHIKKQNKNKKQKYKKKNRLSINFLGGGSKSSRFWQLDPKNAHPKNTIKMGFQQTKNTKPINRHETAIFGQKTKPEIPVIIFGGFPSLWTKIAETHIFIVF